MLDGETMSNLAGKAAAMNVVTPSSPKITWINRLLFMATRAIPSSLGGLLGLSFIHFARWVIIKRNQWPDLGQDKNDLSNDYVLFVSNFNGTWDQYIDAFADAIPSGLNLLWYSASKFPGSIPIIPFKKYIQHNQVSTDYYYNATPGSGQNDIISAMMVNAALQDLIEAHKTQSPEEFKMTYDKAMLGLSRCFGEPGYGPFASLDTRYADINREPFMKEYAEHILANERGD